MSAAETTLSVSYFGKLPSRGDFVKATDSHQFVAMLDDWVGGAMGLLSQAMDWKLIYDAAQPMSFAFMGSRSRATAGGYMIPSRDQSDRRFPFLAAARMDVPQPQAFVGRAPMAYSRLWARLERQSRQAVEAQQPDDTLRALSQGSIRLNADASIYNASYEDFLEIETIGSMDALLAQAGYGVSMKRILLGLGLLMQPVMSSGPARLEKGLALPLVQPGHNQVLLTTLWMDLIAKFLDRASFELLLLVGNVRTPFLTIGFNGGHARALHSVLDPRLHGEHNVVLDQPDWVDEYAAEDHSLDKLASYLEHRDLSLRTARDTFAEAFLGA